MTTGMDRLPVLSAATIDSQGLQSSDTCLCIFYMSLPLILKFCLLDEDGCALCPVDLPVLLVVEALPLPKLSVIKLRSREGVGWDPDFVSGGLR